MNENEESVELAASDVEGVFQSQFRGLYKKRNVLNQEERRRRTLESQKRKRNQLFNLNRDLSEDAESSVEDMVVCKSEEKCERRGKISKILMYSEWLLEVPDDLSEKWQFVPSPVGRRSVVIANKGYTKMYTKWGQFMRKFQSELPYGCKGAYRFEPTILDCIWCELNSTCYVLDVIVWKGQSFRDCEAEFRSYWLRTKFEETPALECLSSKNHCRLELLPSTLYSPSDLANTFGIGSVWACGNPPLDGILFYHRNGHYQSGENTPLVGWLKPFMVPEVLGVEIPDSLMSERPDNYISMEQFIEEYTAERKRSRSKKIDMQVDECHEESIDSESVNVEFEESDSTCLT